MSPYTPTHFLLLAAVALLLGGAMACAVDRVDPAYQALVEQQATRSAPIAGSLGPGDKFLIRVHEEKELSGEYTVSADGTVNYPYIGRIDVQGMTCGHLERTITRGLGDGYLRNPSVSCSIVEYNSKKVFVFGEVEEPGSFPYKSNLTLVDAFALAGGVTARANANDTKLTRQINGAEIQVRVPMQEIVEGRRSNLKLLPGDILYVPESAF
jgi:polysaccharide export outer membrane protein